MTVLSTGSPIGEALGQLLYLILVGLCGWIAVMVKSLKNKRSKSPHVEDNQYLDRRIHDMLGELRSRLNADRAYVSRFHNGDHFIDDRELLKKTRTHESVRDGLIYQGEEYKGILVSTVIDEINLTTSPGSSYFKVKDLPHGKFKWLCLKGGVKAGARCALVKDKKIIGFVGVDFGHEEEVCEIDLVCEYAARIQDFL